MIGVGVTEAGLASPKSKCLLDLAEILMECFHRMSDSLSTVTTPTMNTQDSNKRIKRQGSLVSSNPNGKICVINTDNVPSNGSVIYNHILTIAKQQDNPAFVNFLQTKVSFHNTMVDRITSQREGSNGLVPRAEPVPAKALVIEDLNDDLPLVMKSQQMKNKFGVSIMKLLIYYYYSIIIIFFYYDHDFGHTRLISFEHIFFPTFNSKYKITHPLY